MTKVVKWIAFYDTGKRYDSDIFRPEDLPIDGTQWIVEFTVDRKGNKGKRFVHGANYYAWTGDSWASGNEADLRGWLRLRTRIPIVLYGRWTSDSNYEEIAEQARECCDD